MKNSKRDVWICLAINLILAVIAIFVIGVKIRINDDIFISYTAYGIMFDASSRVVYSHVAFGMLMKMLFKIIPGINWQMILYYAGLIFSGTVGLYSLVKEKNKKLLILWAAFVLCFYYACYISVTFTIVSAFVCCQCYMALFMAVKEDDRKLMVFSGLGILYGSLIRYHTFFGVSAFFAIAWLYFAIKTYQSNKDLKQTAIKCVVPFSIIIGVTVACFAFDRAAYSKYDWRDYMSYNHDMEQTIDFDNALTTLDTEKLEELGVNDSMASVIIAWMFNDPEKIPHERLKAIGDTCGDYQKIDAQAFKEYGQELLRIICSEWGFGLGIILLILLLATADKEQKIFGLVLLLVLLAELFWYKNSGRTDGGETAPRVIELSLIAFWLSIISMMGVREKNSNFSKKIAIPFIAVFCLGSIVIQPFRPYELNGFQLVDAEAINKEYGYMGRNRTYIADWQVIEHVWPQYSAWQSPEEGQMENLVLIGGWLVNHPKLLARQHELGVDNPYRALYENEDVRLLSILYPNRILEYLQENYDERIDCEYIKERGGIKEFRFYIAE